MVRVEKFLLKNLAVPMALIFTFVSVAIQTVANAETLKVAMVQPMIRPGDFKFNLTQFLEEYKRRSAQGADLVVGPEGLIPGYPSNDKLFVRDYIDRSEEAVKLVQEASLHLNAAVVIVHIVRNPDRYGRELQNVLSVYQHGKLLYRQAKILLPTYGPFDDARYFEPGKIKDMKSVEINGFKVAFGICEDLWRNDGLNGRIIYHQDPIAKLKKLRPDLVISLSASPFEKGKQAVREEGVHAVVAKKVGAPLMYVNQVGVVDQLIFDGASFVLDQNGKRVLKLADFKPDSAMITFTKNSTKPLSIFPEIDPARNNYRNGDLDQVEEAVVFGIREFVKQIGHDSVVFGLSGGLDSSMAAYFSARALGPENVYVIKMPSSFSSEGSITDSDKLVTSLGISQENVLTLPIQEIVDAFDSTLTRAGLDIELLKQIKFGSVAIENIQARIRMMLEFFVSNLQGNISEEMRPIVARLALKDPRWNRFFSKKRAKIATSDKSELAVGNGTIYGDIAGVYSPNADLYKTDLWDIGYNVNRRIGREVIPVAILTKEPSPELLAKQVTTDIYPPYRIIDPVLKDLIESGLTPEQLRAKYSHLDSLVAPKFRPLVDYIIRVHDSSEYKREILQGPIARVSHVAFGKERRVTIVVRGNVPVPIDLCREILGQEVL